MPGSPSGRSGHTLVELVVACLVFAIGVLALQKAALAVLLQIRDSRVQTLAVELAGNQRERLANTPCTAALSGAIESRGMQLEWGTAETLGTHARREAQLVRFRRVDSERVDEYRGAVRCR